jgi:hypothetical protein
MTADQGVTMNTYDQFEAEMLEAGKSLDEIERLWNTPPDPFDSERDDA